MEFRDIQDHENIETSCSWENCRISGNGTKIQVQTKPFVEDKKARENIEGFEIIKIINSLNEMSVNLEQQLLAWVNTQTGLDAVSRELNARLDLTFQPEVILPKVSEEIATLKNSIPTRAGELKKLFEDAAAKDEKLKQVPEIEKFQYIANNLIAEINAKATLIRSKYPGAIDFLLNSRSSGIKGAGKQSAIKVDPSSLGNLTKSGKRKSKKP